jgi:hypothetical protein
MTSKLYVSKKNSEVLEQIDLSEPAFPVTRIFSASYGTNHGAGQLELGPDHKLYWIQYAHGLVSDSLPAMYLGVINEPNLPGLSCNFNPQGVWLGGRMNRFSLGLPNHPNYYLGPLVGSPCDTLSNPDTTTSIQPIQVPMIEHCFALKVDPAANSIQIEPTQQFSNAAVEVYNNSGTLQTSATIANTALRVSTHDWPAGLYVVSVRAPEARCPSQKFVVGRP